MTPPHRMVWRVLIGTAAATLLYLGPAAAITTASAHVQATSTDAARGAFATVSFQVPNESTTNAATTAVTVDLTNVSAVQTEAKPGWSAKVDRDAASNTVRSVTWTAAPDAGIRGGPIRGVPDIGEAARRRYGQLPDDTDLRRRRGGEVGPGAGARRSRAGTSRADADAGRRPDTARPPPDPDQVRRPDRHSGVRRHSSPGRWSTTPRGSSPAPP